MYLLCPVIRYFIIVILCVIAWPVQAEFDETYRLDIGASLVEFDSKVRINSRDDSVDEEIDLEDLGFDSQLRLGVVKGTWRMADRHRLSLLYSQIKRATGVTTKKDIEVAGTIIRAGATVASSVKTHVYDIEYLYSYYKRPDLELGVSAGIYWMNSLTELIAEGEVRIEGETQDEIRNNFEAYQRLIAPLPIVGLSASYEIKPQWLAHAYARYLDVAINDIDGRILSLIVKTEYFLTEHVAVGASYASFNVNVRQNGVVFINTLQYGYNGLQASLVLRY